MTGSHRARLAEHVRITGAIAGKDILDAIRNRTTLSIIVGVGVMMLSGLVLPLVLGSRGGPKGIVYDPQKSELVRQLSLRRMASEDEMKATVATSLQPLLGIVIPSEFGQARGPGQAVALDGYVPHWATRSQVAGLVSYFEAELGRASGQTVRIDVQGHRVYPSADLESQPFLLATNMTMQILIVGLSLVPLLLVEEKETRTFDALLVSPARLGHVVTGKALAGLFYCLCGAAVVFVFSARWFVHWDLALLAAFLGAAFAVGLGLLLGAVCENPATINLWVLVAFMALVAPVLLVGLGRTTLPAWVQTLAPCTPAVAMARLVGLATAGAIPPGVVARNAAILAGETVVLYGLVALRVRQADR
jgi:ABC-2 type transport system permease protein